MEKKLIAAFTFGLLAVSVANLLLSVGIVSLLLTWSPGTDIQLDDAGNFPGSWTTNGNSISIAGMNNSSAGADEHKSDMPMANATNATDAMNITSTPVPSTGQQLQAVMPAGGQFMPSAGELPPAGQLQQASGQAQSSGQMPPSAGQDTVVTGQMQTGSGPVPAVAQQFASDASQSPSGMEQYLSGTGPLPDSIGSSVSWTDALPADTAIPASGQDMTALSITATPKPSSFFSNFSGLWDQ